MLKSCLFDADLDMFGNELFPSSSFTEESCFSLREEILKKKPNFTEEVLHKVLLKDSRKHLLYKDSSISRHTFLYFIFL